jgi:cytochrome c-type biogenesis protein CcmI
VNALLIGALVAAAALTFVLWPLFAAANRPHGRPRREEDVSAPPDSAVRALREIEFDRATGKLGDSDYATLKAEYTTRALAELRATDVAVAASVAGPESAGGDAAEAFVRLARATTRTCHTCDSVCAEPDAVYCSTCGAYLPGSCTKCGARIPESGARYCASCGWELAA